MYPNRPPCHFLVSYSTSHEGHPINERVKGRVEIKKRRMSLKNYLFFVVLIHFLCIAEGLGNLLFHRPFLRFPLDRIISLCGFRFHPHCCIRVERSFLFPGRSCNSTYWFSWLGSDCRGGSRELLMENCWDFLQWLGQDVSASVLARLDEPADLVRASAVSRSWRRFGTYSFLLEFALVRYPRKECFFFVVVVVSYRCIICEWKECA